MPDPLSLVEAFAHSRREELEQDLAGLAHDHPLAKTLRVLIRFLDHQVRRDGWDEVDPLLDAALLDPPDSRDLQVCLLNIAFRRALEHGDRDEMDRLHPRLTDCLPDLRSPRARCIVHRLNYFLAESHRDPVQAQRHALLGLGEAAEGSDLWLEFLAKFTDACISNHDFDGLEGPLERLEARRHDLERWGESWVRLRLFFDLERGHSDLALEHIDAFRRETPAPLIPFTVHASILISAGRADEAEAVIAAAARGEITALRHFEDASVPELIFLMRLRLAIARRDLAKAHDLLRRAGPLLRPRRPQSIHFDPLLASLHLALWSRQADQARTLIQTLDPRQDRGDLHAEWLRLHLLEDDDSAAAGRLARLLAKRTPTLVEERLRFAHEVAAHRLARLFQAVCEPRPQPALDTVAPPTVARPVDAEALVGESPAMIEVRRQITLLAPLAPSVLILGETGTGKEVVARELHRQGPCAAGPFVALNCAAIPDALAEAELFGHLKGSFTGAVADQPGLLHAASDGSLLLDEINSLSLRLQGLLLRVLETGDYLQIGGRAPRRTGARFLIAANQDLAALCDSGAFRRDLYYRLQRFVIHLPPLRERRDDIPLLCRRFLRDISGRDDLALDAGLLAGLCAHAWPGNVRELRNEIEHLVLLRGERSVFTRDDCRLLTPRPGSHSLTSSGSWPALVAVPAVDIPGPPRIRERRQRILDLFPARPRLYREDVIQALGCAPNTATADLAALEEAGLIRRVVTGANLRTSYFVRDGA